MKQHEFSWHVLGAGAMGQLHAGYLARDGHHVTLITRHPENESCRFLNCQTVDTLHRTPVEIRTAQQITTPIAHLLVTVKSFQISEALASIQHALTPETHIIVLHNGMGALEEAAETRALVGTYWTAVSQQAAYFSEANLLQHAAIGKMYIGLPITSPTHLTQAQSLVQQLTNAQLPTEFALDIVEKQYEKLVFNSIINPLATLLNCQNGALLDHDLSRRWISQFILELKPLLKILGYQSLTIDLEARTLALIERTANNICSTLQDLNHQRPLEIDYITGHWLKLAAQHKVAMPYHAIFHHQLKTLSAQTLSS